jgi:hypothetical protein
MVFLKGPVFATVYRRKGCARKQSNTNFDAEGKCFCASPGMLRDTACRKMRKMDQ